MRKLRKITNLPATVNHGIGWTAELTIAGEECFEAVD